MGNTIPKDIDLNRLPTHVAIIMDGNGRWAKKHGKMRVFGHKAGVASVREIVEEAAKMGLKYLTLYTFSTENWNRPKYEVNALMELFVATINKEIDSLVENGIKFNAIGNTSQLPSECQNQLQNAIEKTKHNTGVTLTLAISYSARWEIVEAAKNIARAVKKGSLDPETIDEKTFAAHLTTSSIPDPELLIRTSGELRISNFLLWQLAYSELYFTEKLWPEFGKEDLYDAIRVFQNRERRFGMTSEQLKSK